ncbi:SpoIIE family protein phosphatase [Alkalicoccus halolimnae]|uniref:SpoIIE family protein phosphatase n=1 Tax=Alkalicoccus halolimnae TaxID=1667239 RepID=A0A5C7F5L4_9BACI|nr:SpoIIE family protein phosphatase [Alkalicoccus halolimnae]TXF83975.1 SpoIIE family protein phosphatase [Alkalicoccus halolimnae]
MFDHLHLEDAEISVFQSAKEGNWCNGDDYYGVKADGYVLIAVADGLGSGEEARTASHKAMEVIEQNHDLGLQSLLERCNEQMWGTRGVVISILRIYIEEKFCEYVNVGNITCNFYHPDGKMIRPVPKRGYLSGRKQKVRVQTWPYKEGMVFSMYSDGFPQDPLANRVFDKSDTPEEIMNRISDLFENVNDDATVMIGKAYV